MPDPYIQTSKDGIHWEDPGPESYFPHSRKFRFELWCRGRRLTNPIARVLAWYDELWLRG